MYHPPSKKVRLWRRFAVLCGMAIAVVGGLAVLAALTLGYGFNKKDGRIEQGGILQMGTTPSGATASVDGVQLGALTPTKLASQVGNYKVVMNRQGYQSWQKTVPVQAGNITWVTYPRLIPTKLTPEDVQTYPATVASALPSPSSKRYGIMKAPTAPVVSVAMLDQDTVETQDYTLPQALYTHTEDATQSQFAIEVWSGDEKHVLLKHTYGQDGAVEWIVLNLDKPDESINVNRSLGISGSVTEPAFTRSDGREIYAIVDGAVKVLDLNEQTVSRPLVEDVADFRIYGDKFVLFVTKPNGNKQSVGYVKKDYKQPRIVREVAYDGATQAQFDVSKYYDKYYYLVSYGTEASLFSSSNMPDDSTSNLKLTYVKTLSLAHPITVVNMTDNGQFATVQDGSSFSTYNLEISQLSSTDFDNGTAALPQELKYLDGYLLWGVRDAKLHTYEFDGANQHDIMTLAPEFGATLSPTGKYLYAMNRTENGVALTRVQLLDIDE